MVAEVAGNALGIAQFGKVPTRHLSHPTWGA